MLTKTKQGDAAQPRLSGEPVWTLAPAIIALIGVIIGAVVAGGASLYLESRADARELRQAKRLVALELNRNDTFLAFLQFEGKTFGTKVPFPDDAWKRYSPDLARGLNDRDWEAVSRIYLQLAEYNKIHEDRGPRKPLPPPLKEVISTHREWARDALLRLGVEPKTGLRRSE